ncbi:MAG: hypothetical protein IPK72_08955 [Candidatus Eisenbacteria bacterium]|nr:hypothetical protein [Candidatus Eisenbacteria bacterium]
MHQMHLGPDSRPIVDANLVLNGADDVLVTDDALYVVSEAGLSVFEPPCPLVADAPSDPLAPSANGVALRLWPNPASRGTTSFHLALDGVHAGSELHYCWIDLRSRHAPDAPVLRHRPGSTNSIPRRAATRGRTWGGAKRRAVPRVLTGARVVAREKVVQIR